VSRRGQRTKREANIDVALMIAWLAFLLYAAIH